MTPRACWDGSWSSSIKSNPRLRWGAAAALPGVVLLLGAVALGQSLSHGLFLVAALSLAVGGAILFYDLP